MSTPTIEADNNVPGTAYERFSWKETRPGRWERDIDEAEQFYTSLAKAYAGSGRTYFAITGHVSLSVIDKDPESELDLKQRVIDSLRKGWIQLRYDCPTIASWVEYNPDARKCKKVYETFLDSDGDHGEDTWISDTFQVTLTDLSGEEWCNSDPPVPQLPTLFLFTPSHRKADNGSISLDLVLRCHHNVIDGIGTLHLFNNLLTYAAEAYKHQKNYVLPTFGDEWRRLSPPLRVAASIPPNLEAEQKKTIDEIALHNSLLRDDVEIAVVPMQSGSQMPQRHQRVSLALSADETQQILTKCKDHGLSVTHAYHAAIAIAIREIQQRRERERVVRYITYCLINERSRCKPPYNGPKYAASVYHSVSGRRLAIDLTVSAATDLLADEEAATSRRFKADFTNVSQKLKAFYLKTRNDKAHITLVPSYFAQSTLPYQTSDIPVPPPNPSPSVSISSMGTVDHTIANQHGPFEIDNPWVTGEELGTGLGLFLGTYRGKLSLSAAYNDAWHSREGIVKFISACNQAVFQYFGI